PRKLGSSQSNRHRHDRIPHARAARGADEAGADAPVRNVGGGRAAGGIPTLRREQLYRWGGDRHRRRFIGLAAAMIAVGVTLPPFLSPPRPYTVGTRNCLFTQFSSRPSRRKRAAVRAAKARLSRRLSGV